MHECASVCIYNCVFGKGLRYKSISVPKSKELSVLSKNIRLNQCSHFRPAGALRAGSARAHTAETRKPQRDHRGEIPGLSQNILSMNTGAPDRQCLLPT